MARGNKAVGPKPAFFGPVAEVRIFLLVSLSQPPSHMYVARFGANWSEGIHVCWGDMIIWGEIYQGGGMGGMWGRIWRGIYWEEAIYGGI